MGVVEVAVAGSTGATCSIVVIAALLECPVKARIQINVTSVGGLTPPLSDAFIQQCCPIATIPRRAATAAAWIQGDMINVC
jgi:hypothetical protein